MGCNLQSYLSPLSSQSLYSSFLLPRPCSRLFFLICLARHLSAGPEDGSLSGIYWAHHTPTRLRGSPLTSQGSWPWSGPHSWQKETSVPFFRYLVNSSLSLHSLHKGCREVTFQMKAPAPDQCLTQSLALVWVGAWQRAGGLAPRPSSPQLLLWSGESSSVSREEIQQTHTLWSGKAGPSLFLCLRAPPYLSPA